jgi:hypothetical protein
MIPESNLQKWNIAHKIQQPCNLRSHLARIKKFPHDTHIKVSAKAIAGDGMYQPIHQNVGIIDFEGSPVFMAGFLVYDTLLSYYIENYEYRTDFYLYIVKLLKTLSELVLFSFSTYEQEIIEKILGYLEAQGIDTAPYEQVRSIKIVNLQKGKYESMAQAMYSVNSSLRITGDILFRNNSLVNQLFYAHKYREIVDHNHNCLLNEGYIFQKRWVKEYTL